MKKIISKGLAVVCLAAGMLGAASANALYVQAVPVDSTVSVGGGVQVDIVIGDLTDNTAPSLGAYDLDVVFDASILQYTNIIWGDQLDQDQLGSLRLLDDSAVQDGLLNVFEVSYDDIATLDSQQSGEFVLFSLLFTALDAGESLFNIDVLALGDAQGNALTADQVSGASVTAVPLPAALPLLMSGLALVAGRIRRRVVLCRVGAA
jgi:hypothetical protein